MRKPLGRKHAISATRVQVRPSRIVTLAARSRALCRLLRGGMAYAGSPSDGVLRVFVCAAADGDASVASAARAGFTCAARGARRAAVVVAVDALRSGRARAAAATGRCVADPTSLALLPLLSDVVRDAPAGALDDALRAAVRAAALGARPPHGSKTQAPRTLPDVTALSLATRRAPRIAPWQRRHPVR
jgi:hypothetical protein